MTQEQVYGLKLTKEQKDRAIAAYEAARKFNKTTTVFDACKTKADVEKAIQVLQQNYDKRKEAEKRAQERKRSNEEDVQRVISILKDAKEAGLSTEDIIDILNNSVREAYNKKIDDKIAQLQAMKK